MNGESCPLATVLKYSSNYTSMYHVVEVTFGFQYLENLRNKMADNTLHFRLVFVEY